MTDDISVDAQILRDLGEIKATQGYIQNDIMDIKTEIREIKVSNREIEERVRKLETVQAECQAKNAVKTSVVSRAGSLIYAGISAAVAFIVALISSGRI